MNLNDLNSLLGSKIVLLVVETYDELRAVNLLKEAAQSRFSQTFVWSHTDGLQILGFGIARDDNEKTCDLQVALKEIKEKGHDALYVLKDIHHFLDDPKTIRLLKDIALDEFQRGYKIVLISHELRLPAELSRYATSIAMSLPSNDEILGLIREEATTWSKKNQNQRIKTDNESLLKLVNNLQGLTHQDVRRLARGAIADDGAITESDLPEVTRAKFELMDMEGVLHFEYSTAHMRDVAGFNTLKRWLHNRKSLVIETDEMTKDRPKGVLLFGVQGGGKSLAAKAIAGIWGLPLLRLDMACLFNKYIGETERRLRDALKLADTMSPCILWMDELEKGLAQDSSDTGLTQRLLGTLLTWMAERTSSVFMAATSNDISKLPPELIRKGRFDEIFFVDLPSTKVRQEIFNIHLEKRGLNFQHFNLKALALVAEGFTGAEIEQAVISGVYSAQADGRDLDEPQLLKAISMTKPLSVLMAQDIQSLRNWASTRSVNADE